jgi:hypothetical protein
MAATTTAGEVPYASAAKPEEPMPRGAYQTVIEGPVARLKETRRNLTIQCKRP